MSQQQTSNVPPNNDKSDKIDPMLLPFSYHTFIFPFLWKNKRSNEDEQIKKHEIEEALPKSDPDHMGWQPDMLVDKANRFIPGKNTPENYRLFQYFNEAARKALFQVSALDGHDDGHDNGIVSCYTYQGLRDAEYIISTGGRGYNLNINNVRLKVFNTGVAELIFELEYFPPNRLWRLEPDEKKAQLAEEYRRDVLMINEYGRRLYPEFIPKSDKENDMPFLLCADKIVVKAAKKVFSEDDFRARCQGEDGDSKYINRPIYLPKLIMNLLGGGFTDQRENTEGKIYIEPAIDDRMFVCCCVVDGQYVPHFLGYDPNDGIPTKSANARKQAGQWLFKEDWAVGQELFALINIDPSGAKCSCQNRHELDRYLEEQMYTRWLEYGTLHGVSNHSFVCVTSHVVLDEVINPFLTLYTQMCILVLAQRASLIAMDVQVTDAVSQNGDDRWERLTRLEHQFARFQGQLLLAEVTPQIQGIELYDKLQKMLFIDKLEDNLQRQLNNLYEIAEAELQSEQESREKKEDQRMNLLLSAVGALAIVSAICDMEQIIENSPCRFGISLVLDSLLFVVIFFIFKKLFYHPDKKKQHKKNKDKDN